VLQEATYELVTTDRAWSITDRASRFHLVRHRRLVNIYDAVVADGGSIDIRREVFQCRSTVADGFDIDHPLLLSDVFPDCDIDLIEQACFAYGSAELGSIHDRSRFLGQQEVGRSGLPTRTVRADSTARHHEVNVWMIDRRVSTPGVKSAEEPQSIHPDETRTRSQLANRLAASIEQACHLHSFETPRNSLFTRKVNKKVFPIEFDTAYTIR